MRADASSNRCVVHSSCVVKTADKQFAIQLSIAYAAGLAPGMVLFALTPSGAHVRFWALGIGSFIGLLYWLCTRAVMRKRLPALQHRDLLIFILLPYQVWTGYAAVAFLNRALDGSPAVLHELTVLEHERRRKGNDKITLGHWRQGAPPFEVDGYEDVGTVLEARSHVGRLGLEWIEIPLRRRTLSR